MVRKTSKKQEEPKPLPDTPATKLWERIKNRPIDLFGMPNQTVEMYCYYAPIDDDVVYLIPKASAVLPALEETLKGVAIEPGQEWLVELAGQYIRVSLVKSNIPV